MVSCHQIGINFNVLHQLRRAGVVCHARIPGMHRDVTVVERDTSAEPATRKQLKQYHKVGRSVSFSTKSSASAASSDMDIVIDDQDDDTVVGLDARPLAFVA